MFPDKAQSQPASPRVLPTAPIRATDCTMQSRCPADGQSVLKHSAAALGKHNQVSGYTLALSLYYVSCALVRCYGSLGFGHSPDTRLHSCSFLKTFRAHVRASRASRRAPVPHNSVLWLLAVKRRDLQVAVGLR